MSQTILGLHLRANPRGGVKAHILSVFIRKDKAGVYPQSLRMPFIAGLLNLQLIKNVGTAFGNIYRSVTAHRLGGFDSLFFSLGLINASGNSYNLLIEVNIIPHETDQFAASHSGGNRKCQQGTRANKVIDKWVFNFQISAKEIYVPSLNSLEN